MWPWHASWRCTLTALLANRCNPSSTCILASLQYACHSCPCISPQILPATCSIVSSSSLHTCAAPQANSPCIPTHLRATLNASIQHFIQRFIHDSSRCKQAAWSSSSSSSSSSSPSTPSSADAPDMKAKLRELYKRIHPDLFQQHPEAQAENSRSFQLLQEYLDAALQGGGERGGVLLPYRFVFYLHNDDACQTDQPDEVLRKVTLTLSPPPRIAVQYGAVPRAALIGLQRILKACGLDDSFVIRDEDDIPALPLRKYMPQALRVMQKRAQTYPHHGTAQQLSLVRLALRHGRGISVAFGPPLASAPPTRQLTALEDLAHALDRCPDTIRSLHITLGDRFDVNLNGAITLDATLPWSAWTTWMHHELSAEKCHARASLLSQQRALERSVEDALGLRMLYCLPELQGSPAYQRLLQRLVDEATHKGPLLPTTKGPPPPPMMSVCVAGALPSDPLKTWGVELDSERGLVWLGIDSGAHTHTDGHDDGNGGGGETGYDDNTAHGGAPSSSPQQKGGFSVHAQLQQLAPTATRAAQRIEDERTTTARLQRQVERALRLRRLVREVPMPRFSAACARMVSHAAQLMPVMESMSVVVSDGFGVAADGSYVRIPWDFEV